MGEISREPSKKPVKSRENRAGGAFKILLKHCVQGAALPAMLPSSPSADLFQMQLYGPASAGPFFAAKKSPAGDTRQVSLCRGAEEQIERVTCC